MGRLHLTISFGQSSWFFKVHSCADQRYVKKHLFRLKIEREKCVCVCVYIYIKGRISEIWGHNLCQYSQQGSCGGGVSCFSWHLQCAY